MGQPGSEPSMEDILASIKRIIAEDSEAAAARMPRHLRRGPVAVPDPVPDDAGNPDILPEPVADDEPADILELTSPLVEPEAIDPEPEPMTAVDPEPAPVAPPPPAAEAPASAAILSGASEAASRSAFAALGRLQVRGDDAAPGTLEGLVADLLRPMLRDWLDRELPALVERLVQDEIRRVSGRS